MRCYTQQGRALSGGFSHAAQIEMLKIANTAMNDFEMISRSRAAKIALLHERHRHAACGRIPGGARTVRAPANDYEVIIAPTQVL